MCCVHITFRLNLGGIFVRVLAPRIQLASPAEMPNCTLFLVAVQVMLTVEHDKNQDLADMVAGLAPPPPLPQEAKLGEPTTIEVSCARSESPSPITLRLHSSSFWGLIFRIL